MLAKLANIVAVAAFACLVVGFAWEIQVASETAYAPMQQENAAQKKHRAYKQPIEKRETIEEASARYTWWLTLFTGILAVATVGLGLATLGLYLAGERQLRVIRENAERQSEDMQAYIAAAHDANEISHQSIVADQRAWILVTDLRIEGSDLIFKRGVAALIASVKISNVGKTPALSVHTKMDMVYGYDEVPSAVRTLSDAYRKVDKVPWTRTLLPNESYRRKWAFIIEPEPKADLIFPVIIGCTTYQISPDKSAHQTAFVFHLYECPSGEPSEFVNAINPKIPLVRDRIGWDGGAGGFAD